MAQFVVNEWLWADASGEMGVEPQRRVLELLDRIASSDHQVVIVEKSEFDRKAWLLCKSTNQLAVEIAKIYVLRVRQNSDRCRILDEADIVNLPEPLQRSIKPDDRYLVRAQLSAPGAILVSTDAPLRRALSENNLPCVSREAFFATYFSEIS